MVILIRRYCKIITERGSREITGDIIIVNYGITSNPKNVLSDSITILKNVMREFISVLKVGFRWYVYSAVRGTL